MVNVVKGVVDKEAQFGYDTQLFAASPSEFIAYASHVGVDIGQYLVSALGGKDRKIGATHAKVGADVCFANAHQHAVRLCRLQPKDIAKFFL